MSFLFLNAVSLESDTPDGKFPRSIGFISHVHLRRSEKCSGRVRPSVFHIQNWTNKAFCEKLVTMSDFVSASQEAKPDVCHCLTTLLPKPVRRREGAFGQVLFFFFFF